MQDWQTVSENQGTRNWIESRQGPISPMEEIISRPKSGILKLVRCSGIIALNISVRRMPEANVLVDIRAREWVMDIVG